MTNSTEAAPELDVLFMNEGFIRAIARGLLGRDDLAEDIVQETWLVALHSRHSRPRALRSWLGGIARNLSLRVRRREAVQRRAMGERPDPRTEPSPEEIVAREETRRRVVRALLALDELYRRPLLLRFYEGLSHREVARRLGVPLETARTRMKRGLARLRDRLDVQHGGDRRKWATAILPLAAGAGVAAGAKVVTAAAIVALAAGLTWWSASAGPEQPAPPTPTASAAAVPDADPPPAAPSRPDRGAPLPAADPAPATHTVSGTVVDAVGKPLEVGRVLAFSPPYSPFASSGSRHTMSQLDLTLGPAMQDVVARADVAANGAFRIVLPTAKSFVLVAQTPGYASDGCPVYADTKQAKIEVRRAGRLIVALAGPDGPVTEGVFALQRVEPSVGEFGRQDDGDGWYDWPDRTFPLEVGPVNPGLWKVQAWADDPEDPDAGLTSGAGQVVAVAVGETRRVELLLSPREPPEPREPKARWHLRLVDLEGESIGTEWLGTTLNGSAPTPMIEATWPGGRRGFRMKRDGTATLWAPDSVIPRVKASFGAHTLDRHLPADGGEERIVIPLRSRDAVHALAGRVVDDAGAAVEGVGVTARGRWRVSRFTKTDLKGRFRIERLLPGPWTVRWWHVLHEGGSRPDVAEGATGLELLVKRKPEPATLRVRVRAPRAEFGEARILILKSESRREWDWWFHLDGVGEGKQMHLPPGPYRVIAQVPTRDGALIDYEEVTVAQGDDKRLELGGDRLETVTLRSDGATVPRRFDWSVRHAGSGRWIHGPDLAAVGPAVIRFPRGATSLSVAAQEDAWRPMDPFPSPKGEIILRWKLK